MKQHWVCFTLPWGGVFAGLPILCPVFDGLEHRLLAHGEFPLVAMI